MQVWLWAGFLIFITAVLAVDLGLINRKAHAISGSSAFRWVGVFVAMGFASSGVVYYLYESNVGEIVTKLIAMESSNVKPVGEDLYAALLCLQAWVIEYSLSVDNIFVMALIFGAFRVPAKFQYRILFWGILGAVILGGILILAGASRVQYFEPILYLFNAFLIFTTIKLLVTNEHDTPDFEKMLIFRAARKLFPLSPQFDGQRFFTRLPDGTRAMTPLFLVLLVVEATDVDFAVDSILACFSITKDPFIVFTSNIFAILGLRSLYFALATIDGKFAYLKYSVVVILGYVGIKMILELALDFHINAFISLGVVVGSLGSGVLASILWQMPVDHEALAKLESASTMEATAASLLNEHKEAASR